MDPTSPAKPRPRLAVVYGHRSLDAIEIRDGARDWCDLIWLVDARDPSAMKMRPMLNRFGVVVAALGKPPAEAAAALRTHAPDGIATFYDTGMEHVAQIAHELGLPFHAPADARGLEDKLHQREAFHAAGVPGPRYAGIPAAADRAEVERLGGDVGFPAVLKPRRASGSWHTFPVADARELGRLWDELLEEGPEDMLLEEYLSGVPVGPGGFEADYVSVETVVEAGRMTHLAITGRFPPAPPFRETGFFIPSTLARERAPEVLELAGRALGALGFAVGAAHTEIKLTPEGPRVLEVNGRIGGGVPAMLRLVAGVDLVKATMRAALGLPAGVEELPPTDGVGYRFFFQPPASARRLVSIEGIDRLRRVDGVESVHLHYPPGTGLDARHGTRTYLFAAVGKAADHAGVVAVDEFIRTEIHAVYDE